MPKLYGAVPREDGADVKPYAECLPDTSYPKTIDTAHYAGNRKCDSGDTGAQMTVADFSKYYDFILRGGTAPDGTRLLSADSVKLLTHGTFEGLTRTANSMGTILNATGEAGSRSFNYGWATSVDGPHCNGWAGYANNEGKLYVEDDSYILFFPQVMANTPGAGLIGPTWKDPVFSKFVDLWQTEAAAADTAADMDAAADTAADTAASAAGAGDLAPPQGAFGTPLQGSFMDSAFLMLAAMLGSAPEQMQPAPTEADTDTGAPKKKAKNACQKD